MTSSKTLLADIEYETRATQAWTGRVALNPRVLSAMAQVPRHRFVPERHQTYAYANGPLPIGHGQTISQPFIVALMTDLLDCGPDARVLEIGTGSGYQSAVLSRVVKQVYSVEIIPELAERAQRCLTELGYDNIETRVGDGYDGWTSEAPFDGILVTAAAPAIPPALTQQLTVGASLIIPVGPANGHQELIRVQKLPDGELATNTVLSVAFVPLTRRSVDQV